MSEFINPSKIQEYYQPSAGNTEKFILLKPFDIFEDLISSYNGLKDYTIHEIGKGFKAAEFILQHIVTNKLNSSFNKKNDLWHKTVAVKVECEILAAETGRSFTELKPARAEDIHPEFATTEGPERLADIHNYTEKFSKGEEVAPPLYVTGAVLNDVGANIDPKMIFMMDGARRITAAALAHKPTISVYLLMCDVEYAQLIKDEHLQRFANQIKQIQWFDSYQTIPLVGLQGQRSLKRFDLIDMSIIQGQAVMDFGCNLGQSCIKAVQAGASEVIGIEGMPDTFAVAKEIGKTIGFPNLHYLNVDFNNKHFNRQIDEYYPDKVDFSFFLSVYRTKELNQREKLFNYIISKTNKGIFFEGHAHPQIDTREYYDWLFECFKLKYKFLGYSEGKLRPLFYCPIESQSSYRQISPGMTETSPGVSESVFDENKYTVSAIVSTYKSKKFIEGKIQDLLDQTIGNQLEIIIIDSNSPENERAIVAKYIQKHKNIKFIRTKKRETVYQAWNRGIQEAHGKFITNANTDDRLKPDAFEILVDELNSNSDIALVYGDFFITNRGNQDFCDHIRCGYSIKPEYSPDIMLSGCHMGPFPMWRKSLHDEIGYFDENLQSAGDYEFWCRLATKYSMKHINKFIGLYYHKPKGIVNRAEDKSKNETGLIKEKYKDKFPPPSGKTATGYYYKDQVGKNKYVNISMVTYNRLDFTKQAIASVLKNTRYPHVITVVDNGSTDGSREYLKKMHQKGIIKNILLLDENVGVSKASNLAWKMESDAEYYLKLDNDIVIFKTDWLSAMIQMVDAIPQIGAIAYNFEVQSYPLTEIGGLRCRVKAEGNLGGACILIPKRIREQLGYWCEEYGLYGEEDADYDFRIKCKGLLNVYMEDENIGFHLPGGKAAVIDPHTFTAADGQEEIQQADYRKWKDEMRRNNVTKGKFYKNLNDYSKGIRSLFAESKFADQYFKQKGISTELNDPIERKEEKICESKVSIIIPVFNQLAFTKKCLNAIFRNTPSDLFEIIIIDNASTDETVRYLSDLGERIKLITNNQNMGFAKACNQGAQKASGKYLLFLNNDTEVQPEWLNALVEVLDKDKSVAAVGSKMLFPDKKIQHAGVAIVNNQKIRDPLFAQHIYYQQAENYPQANQISTYQALTAACMLVRRSAFEAVDRFDERYWNGYEDIDLCFKFQKRGWLLIYQPTSVVIHYESQSGPERFNRVQHNIERLHQKWLGKINPDLMIETNGTEIETGAGCIRPYQIETFANRQRIDSTKSIKQLTSIVILTCNQIEYTKKCIDSIYKQTPEPFELILVDNGSTDGTVQYLESEIADRNEAIRVKIIKNKKNKGFAAGNNQGIAIAKGDYILLMNNDVVVTPGWLGRMIACAEKDSKIGIVGPCSNYVSGPQLVEKVNYDVNTLKGLTEFSNQFAAQHSQQEQQILRVVGFCMLIKRAVIEAVGGMDNRYGLGNFEDDDFSLRATIAGFKSCIASDSFIHHFGSRTFVGENIDYRNSLTKNWELFKEKWGLPFELPYGSPYSLSQMKHTLFDPIVHYYPLQEEDYSTMNFDDHLSKVEDLYAGIEKQFKTMSTNEAIAEIEKLLANHPEFAIGYNDLGVLHYQVGNKEDSLKNYETAVRLDPENITFKKNLADFYFVEIGQVDAALRIYIEVLEKNPKDIEILLITGHICVALHKFEDAKVFYRRVLELEPYNEDAQNNLTKLEKMPLMTSAYNSAEEMYQEIQPLLNNGDQHKAIASLGKLLERFPDFTLAHNDLGVLYYYTGDKEKAQHHYERAVELTPDNINFQKNLADFYCIELGRIEDALKIYVSILTTDPQDVETLMATGQICKALEKFDDARDFFNQVLQIEPWNADARKQMEEMERPMPGASLNSESTEDAYRRLQEKLNALTPAQAVVELEKLVESYPEFAVGHNDLGVLYYNTGNKEKALHHYRQAANLQPENMTLQKNLADFLFVELEKVEEALQIYVDILASHPDDVETLLISGHICVALKKFDDAKDFYERVLTLEPDNQDAKKNLQALIDRQSERLSARPDSLNDVTVSSAKVEAADLNTEEFENQDADHQPIVSIIISLEGIQNRVKQCIESITAHTEESHEIILINSGATKGVLKWAQNIVQDNAHYQLLKCDKMHNWAQGLNQAVKAAAGEYIVLMHNDVMVADRWLSSMLQCFRAGSAIGIVGPMTNETSGIQKAYFSDDRDPNLLESDAKAFYAQNQYRRIPTTRLASFFLMFRHELTDKIGDFDAQLVSEQAVVVDFCKRSAAGGFQNLVAGDVFVYHADRHKGSRKTSDAVQVPAEDQKRLKENWNKTAGDQRFLKGIQMTSLLETVNKLHQKGYLNQAVETLLNAIGAIPEETRLYLALAEISIALRRYQDAIDTLNEMPADAKTEMDSEETGNLNEPGLQAPSLIVSENHAMKTLEILGYAEEGLENFAAAEAYADRMLAIDPISARALNLKGILAYRKEDWNAAGQFFENSIASDPSAGEPYSNLATVKLAAGQEAEAWELLEKAFILNPTDLDIATNYHSIVAARGEHKKAEGVVRGAAAIYPNSQKINYMLIDVLLQQGKHDEAMGKIETAIVKFGIEDGILAAALKVREKLGPMTIQPSKKKAAVSCCMIIKDEEKYLARCLASVKPIIDEMIVVDTGSADRSKDIATAFGALVYDLEWQKDFAKARNFSLEKASGDWVLILDGDEVISSLDYKHFNRIVENRPKAPVAYSIVTRNYSALANIIGWVPNDGKYINEEAAAGWIPSIKTRLFYGKDQIWFEGAVHELVDPVVKRKGFETKQCSIPVHHYGRLDKGRLKRKGEVYFEIGKKKMEEMGDDIFAVREMAIQATTLEENEMAIELWQRLISLEPAELMVADAYINMATLYNRLSNFEQALSVAKKGMAKAPHIKESLYNYAMAELHVGNAQATIKVLEDLVKRVPDYPPARFILSAAYFCIGEKGKGFKNIRKLQGTDLGPNLVYPIFELAETLLKAQQNEYALLLLGTAIEYDIANKKILELFNKCIQMRETTKNSHERPVPLTLDRESINF